MAICLKIVKPVIFPTTQTQQSVYVVTEQCTLKIPLRAHASSNHPIRARGARKRLRHATGFRTLSSAILSVA